MSALVPFLKLVGQRIGLEKRADLDEEAVQSLSSGDVDVSIEDRRSELEHAERDQAQLHERRLVRLLADGKKHFPRERVGDRKVERETLRREERDRRG